MIKFYVQGFNKFWLQANHWEESLIRSGTFGSIVKKGRDEYLLVPNCCLDQIEQGILPPRFQYQFPPIDCYVELINKNLEELELIVELIKRKSLRSIDSEGPTGSPGPRTLKSLPPDSDDDWFCLEHGINDVSLDYCDILSNIKTLTTSLKHIKGPSKNNYIWSMELIRRILSNTTSRSIHEVLLETLRTFKEFDRINDQISHFSGYIVNLSSGNIRGYIATSFPKKEITKFFPKDDLKKLSPEKVNILRNIISN